MQKPGDLAVDPPSSTVLVSGGLDFSISLVKCLATEVEAATPGEGASIRGCFWVSPLPSLGTVATAEVANKLWEAALPQGTVR